MSKMQTFELLSQVIRLSRFDPLDDVELETAYAEMDVDGDCEIGFDEFFAWWRDNRRKLESKSVCKGNRKLLWSIFRDYDDDETASVARGDFDQLILTMTRKADIEQLDASALKTFKSCGDVMDFEDFCNWWDRQTKVENSKAAAAQLLQTRSSKTADFVRKNLDEMTGGTLITGTVDALGEGTEQVTRGLYDIVVALLKTVWWVARLDLRLWDLWCFITAEVDTDRNFTDEQWLKIFVLQLLSYCVPPLVFFRCVRKSYVMPMAAQVDEFMKRMLWTGTILALRLLNSWGLIRNVSQTEVYLPTMMYCFFALLAAAEEASLTGTEERRVSWRKRFFYRAYVRCFPLKTAMEDDSQDGGGAEPDSEALRRGISRQHAAAHDHVHDSGFEQVPLRLKELGSTLVKNVEYDSLHKSELEHVFANLLTEQPGYFSEVLLRIHQGQKGDVGRSSLEASVMEIADPPSTATDCQAKRQQYEGLLVSLKRQELDQRKFDGKSMNAEDQEFDRLIEDYDLKVVELRKFTSSSVMAAAAGGAGGGGGSGSGSGSGSGGDDDGNDSPQLSSKPAATKDGYAALDMREMVRKRPAVWIHFATKNYHFAKTGSGQPKKRTQESRRKNAFSAEFRLADINYEPDSGGRRGRG